MAEQDTNTAQATDQNQDTSGQAAQGDQGTQGTQANEGDKGRPFTPEQEQFLGSWMGRIIKKQFDENVIPHLHQKDTVAPPVVHDQDDALKKFNEKVVERFLNGDAVGAVEMVQELKERAKQNLSQTQNINLLKGLTTYSDKPYYEDIQGEMQKLARDKVAKGWPPDAALNASYAEAKAAFLENKITGEERGTGLNLTTGGRHNNQRNKPVKLPPQYEAQCRKDIADGLYKNRDEWIGSLSPRTKEQLGI